MKKRARAWKSPFVVFLAVFSIVLVASTFATRAMARSNRSDDTTKFVANWQDIARVGHVDGNSAAAVTVVVFADYQCVGCAAFHKMLLSAKQQMPAELRFVTRHFPLTIHARAAAAANAAECAAEQGRFAQMEDVLYAEQDSIGRTPWSSFAIRADVRDTLAFNTCVKKETYASAVERDRQVAKQLVLEGTPTYIVNGALHFGAPDEATFLQQLRDAASVARVAKLDSARAAGNAPSAGTPVRTWFAPLTLERTIAGTGGDELLMPGSIAATSRGELAVFDYGAMEVRTFSRDGKPLWREGRKGAGPGEYRNIMDLKVRANGEFALLDMANRRITALSPNGKVRRTIPIKLSSSRFVAVADTNVYTLAGDDSVTLWNSISLNGEPVRRMPVPGSLIARHAIAREQFSAALGERSVMAYRWSDKILVLQRDGSVESIIDGIEPIMLPDVRKYPAKYGNFTGTVARVDPKATPATLFVATHGHQIFVLFAGASDKRGRIIDVYDADTQRYSGSYLLPVAAQELVVLPDGAIATLRMEPIPALDVWVNTPSAAAKASVKMTGASRSVR